MPTIPAASRPGRVLTGDRLVDQYDKTLPGSPAALVAVGKLVDWSRGRLVMVEPDEDDESDIELDNEDIE